MDMRLDCFIPVRLRIRLAPAMDALIRLHLDEQPVLPDAGMHDEGLHIRNLHGCLPKCETGENRKGAKDTKGAMRIRRYLSIPSFAFFALFASLRFMRLPPLRCFVRPRG